LAIDQHVVSGVGIGIAGDVWNAASTGWRCWGWNSKPILPAGKWELVANSTSSSSAARGIVPYDFTGYLVVLGAERGSSAAQHEGTGSGKVDVIVAIVNSI
jgi:hypothetical protein